MIRVLVGDVGGTNTRLALAEVADGMPRIAARRDFLNADASDLESLVALFLRDQPHPAAACLAVAGPTDGRYARLTNLPWAIDAAALERSLGIERVELVNDFVAVGDGLAALGDLDVAVLQPGEPLPLAPRVALGAGTGLGVAQCVALPGGWLTLPSEGGHMAFAPADTRQDRLLRHLRRVHGRVSLERILSGPGLSALYDFCWGESELPGAAPNLTPAQVSEAALAGQDGVADMALDLFCRILGQAAGDLALLAQARGGVYLAGGIAPKVLDRLRRPDILAGFRDKGRFSEWMASVPLCVVLDGAVGLKGAALRAVRP